MMKVASMGYHVMLADLMWIRAVLQFVKVVESGEQAAQKWLHAMLDSVILLDPQWRTPYFYGGSMLRVLKDFEGSDRVFAAGMDALPEDPYFPFSLAMNAYLYRGDAKEAARLMTRAASLPQAPGWYRTAVGGFMHKSGQRRAALRYLKEQINAAMTDQERLFLANKYRTLLHEELSAGLEDRRKVWEAERGGTLADLADLGVLPPDPYAAGWIISIDGAIRSKYMDGVVAEREKLDERSTLTRRWLRAR
jgi:tetratricopeptide (TPR) repeat protein